jgi:glycosyltransferase involved in cell wall biosynthesis
MDLNTAKIVYTLYDMSVFEHPGFSTEQNRWSCFNGIFNAANYADFILSISNYSMKKFLDIFPHFPPERISVAYPGNRFNLSQESKKNNYVLSGLKHDKFWLAVGTLEPRKNLRRLLNAYSVYVKKSDNVLPLVLAGGKGWLEDDLEQFVAELDLSQKVVFLGYVSDEDLNWLYGNCFAFIYPSLYEGFGLPVVEAMSREAAAVVSNVTSIPEVAGDAVHYVDPLKEKEIFEGICLLAEDAEYRQKLKSLALKQARKFSWIKCASEVIEIYNHVIALPKR